MTAHAKNRKAKRLDTLSRMVALRRKAQSQDPRREAEGQPRAALDLNPAAPARRLVES
jgi:hypothetical protein